MSKILTAHQPNFIPWEPYFSKVRAADVFVLIAGCQFEKNGYQNRFRGNGRWYTMPVSRGLEPIAQKKYVRPTEAWQRIKSAVVQDSPAWATVLDGWDRFVGESLAHTNGWIIKDICSRLGLAADVVWDFPTEQNSTGRLVELCLWYGCDVYLSGPSGKNYLDQSQFEREGIEIRYAEHAVIGKPILEVLTDAA